VKNKARFLGLVALGLVVSACSGAGEDEPLPFPAEVAQDSLSAKLDAATGAHWFVHADETTKTPFLYIALDEGRPVLTSSNDPAAPLAFLEPFAADFGLDSTFERAFGSGVFSTVAPGALPTIRYVQRVPGTEIQVFDGELLVGLSADRRLEYVKPRIVRHLASFSTVPAIDAERAAQIVATQVGASEMEDRAPVLGVFAANLEEPFLAWRLPGAVDGRTVLVTVDALTGGILETRPMGSGAVEAYSAERFYASGTDGNGAPLGRRDPRFRQDARLPVDIARPPLPFLPQASLWSVTSGLVISIQDKLGMPVLATNIQNELYAADVGNDPKLSNGIGVNAQYNLKQAVTFFDVRFGHNGWAVPLVVARVHADAPGDGHFDAGLGIITLGDGKRARPSEPYETYSPATSLDFVTHEYAHGVIAQLTRAPTRHAYGLGTSGEPGAIGEGFADIFAATADMNATKSLSNAFKFAQDLDDTGKGIRDFLHPLRGTAPGVVHRSGPSGTWGLRSFHEKDDNGNVHYNSTLVSQAWALMAWGGFNDYTPYIGVERGIGVALATQLFWETLPGISSANLSFSALADLMLRYQAGELPSLKQRPELRQEHVRKAVVCAWFAVGAISELTATERYKTQCVRKGTVPKTCANKPAGVYCNPDPTKQWDAFRCDGTGGPPLGVQCATGTFCHTTDGGPSSPAIADEKGNPVCFPFQHPDAP